jgi:hypothetical protein
MRTCISSAAVTIAILGLLIGSCKAATSLWVGRKPVYTVTMVRAGLRHAPRLWVGRTLHLQGTAACCFLYGSPRAGLPCLAAQSTPFDPCPEDAALPLQSSPRPQSRFLQALSTLPLIGPLLAPAQVVRWGAVATYRVQLRPFSAACPNCYAVMLTDSPLA